MHPDAWSPLRQAQERAKATGLHTFTIPSPCKHGHMAPRYASNANCVACAKQFRSSNKPAEERQLTLRNASSRVTQVTEDKDTTALVSKAKRYLRETVGRPVSASLIHRAGIHLLAKYLRDNPPASNVRNLFP